MVGPWPLAPHHDLIMVFTPYTILMQLGSKSGYYKLLGIQTQNMDNTVVWKISQLHLA